ncbi:MAG: flavin reductase family protein [Beijerinckiaceae bacterium]|jgi:flavin reductase (DIM6/NTAB) family NADH-FMN oxidoreductase RutF|nr:flavin reductase family protein [Beijerinckiaceae bacterium]
MFYKPHERDTNILPHNPLTALIAPRPVGWISTMSKSGAVNLAPYSFFNAIAYNPPMVMVSSDSWKDTLTFASETGEFVWNMATWDLREQMNLTSAELERGVNEFGHAKLETAPCNLVKAPRVAASPVSFECKVATIMPIIDASGKEMKNHIMLGEVIGIHIDDRYIRDGRADTAAMKPIARCGYSDYAVVTELFEMVRPGRE